MCFWMFLEVQWTRIPPTNAGYMGWVPAQGRLHATEKLNLCATTTEPTCHNYWSLLAKSPGSTTRSHHRKKRTLHSEEQTPPMATREKPVQQQRPSTAKSK